MILRKNATVAMSMWAMFMAPTDQEDEEGVEGDLEDEPSGRARSPWRGASAAPRGAGYHHLLREEAADLEGEVELAAEARQDEPGIAAPIAQRLAAVVRERPPGGQVVGRVAEQDPVPLDEVERVVAAWREPREQLVHEDLGPLELPHEVLEDLGHPKEVLGLQEGLVHDTRDRAELEGQRSHDDDKDERTPPPHDIEREHQLEHDVFESEKRVHEVDLGAEGAPRPLREREEGRVAAGEGR